MIKTGVYRISNKINKKIYIGSASQSGGIRGRYSEHKSDLRSNKHPNKHLQSAWNKYGEVNFIFEVILYCDPEKCLFFEQKCLDRYQPWSRDRGYNILKNAGNSLGYKMPTEYINFLRKRMIDDNPMKLEINKEKIRGSKNGMFGRIGYNRGFIYKHSEETKQKLREINLGKKNPCCGIKSPRHRAIERIDIITGEVKEYLFMRQAKDDGFNHGNIWQCCNNKRDSYKNFYWRYV